MTVKALYMAARFIHFCVTVYVTVKTVNADRMRPYLGQILGVTVRIDRTGLTVQTVGSV